MIKLIAELPAYIAVAGLFISRFDNLDLFVASALLLAVTLAATTILKE